MSILVNIENYEAFYLDYLEGNLDEEQTRAFLLFLDQHPDLKLEDELPSFVENDAVHLDSAFISGLKMFDASQLITEDNYEQFMIASVEQQLPATKQVELNDFIGRREYLKTELDLYQKTKLIPDLSLVYPGKTTLKRGLVVPMYVRFAAVAASIVLILMFIPWKTSPESMLTARLASVSVNINTRNPQADQQHGVLPVKAQAGQTDQKRLPVVQQAEASQEKETIALLKPKKLHDLQGDPMKKELLALELKKTEISLEKQEEQSFYLGLDEMKNPVSFLTKGIKNKFKQDVDLRVAKASKTKQGGFYLKIGKFEFSRKTAPVEETLASY
jgi:hypothetical protein